MFGICASLPSRPSLLPRPFPTSARAHRPTTTGHQPSISFWAPANIHYSILFLLLSPPFSASLYTLQPPPLCNAPRSGHPAQQPAPCPSSALASQVRRNHAQPRLVLFSCISSRYHFSSFLLQTIIQNGSRQAWKRCKSSIAHTMDTYPDTFH